MPVQSGRAHAGRCAVIRCGRHHYALKECQKLKLRWGEESHPNGEVIVGSQYVTCTLPNDTNTTTTVDPADPADPADPVDPVDPADPAAVDLQLKVLCLDRSGSMVSFGTEVQEGVNEYLNDIQKLHSNICWSVVTFDDEIEIPVRNKKVTASSTLKETWTTPRGCTALRDGILSSIQIAEQMIKEKKNSYKNISETISVEIVREMFFIFFGGGGLFFVLFG